MNPSIKNFLEFNGQSILFLAKDGTYWIAIRPICRALNVSYTAQYKRLKNDPILGSVLSVQTMQVPSDQPRNMVCVPEKFVYGWIFSIQSESPDLLEYKWKVYEILFDYFQGTITQRTQLLREKSYEELEIARLEAELADDPKYSRLAELKSRRRKYSKELKELDKEMIQLELFKN
jgi:hypothetical protein